MAAKYDIVKATKRLKGELSAFHMDFERWRRFKTRYRLDWQKVRFDPNNRHLVPEERGMYVFTVELEPSKLPAHGYMMYVGITGHQSNNANLRRRYGQYLASQRKDQGRSRVRFLLKNWKKDLFFNFVPLPNVAVDLEKMEQAFINAVYPPVNRTDFDADLGPAVIAAF